MNKYQEALNYLDWFCKKPHQEQQDLLQELIDKETPMTPVNRELENLVKDGWITIVTGHCPACDYEDLNQTHDYCSSCGQKLDWID